MHIAPVIAAAFLLLYGLDLLLLSTLNRRWRRRPWVRRACTWVPVVSLLSAAVWVLGAWRDWTWLVWAGAGILSLVYLYLLGLLLALLLTGLGHGLEQSYDWVRGRLTAHSAAPVPERRRFLRASLAAVPLLTSTAVTNGVLGSTAAARMPVLPMRFPGLPPRLAGFRMLHVTDAHIGLYVQLRDLEELLVRAAEYRPDLVLLTGDMCDHLPSYPEVLRLIEGLEAPFGAFASLGNHEYFRGIQQIRKEYDRSAVPLLVDRGVVLQVRGQALHLAGADDPRYLGDPHAYSRLQGFVERSQDAAPADAFRILLSHRSQGLDYAAPLGVHLTVSGHTHGFQVGMGGRSLFESYMPERYIWGRYQKGASQLYTSSGVGHWFPFRLGCPPEAPILVLEPG
jgi:predicted MPP superfamily phosphohydrolase